MKYAIIEVCGKQVWVEPGKFYDFPKLPVDVGNSLNFTRVLLVNDGSSVHIGKPCVDAKVCGTVLSQVKSPKILVYKMKSKKKYRRKMGHREELTRLMVNSIVLGA